MKNDDVISRASLLAAIEELKQSLWLNRGNYEGFDLSQTTDITVQETIDLIRFRIITRCYIMANKPQPNFEFCNNYGDNYKRLRTDKGLTQKELAKALNIVHSTISDIEKSKNPPTIEQLQAYHKYFGVSYEYLLGETKVQSPDIQMICEYTGLSEAVVKRLRHLTRKETVTVIIEQCINKEPAVSVAEVEPVKHGRWEISCDGYYPYCSECKNEPQGRVMTDYCPNCGAKMDLKENDYAKLDKSKRSTS